MKKAIIYILLLLNVSIWLAVLKIDSSFQLIACDVGQGDAILIQKESFQILVDGGPSKKVLDCLGKHMPFWDRKIEAVILTHPDLDHYGGLINVFQSYEIDNFFTNGSSNSSQEYKVLEKEVGSQGLSPRYLVQGVNVVYDLIHLDILNPEADHANKNNGDKNNESIVILLKFKDFEALLTGDAEQEVSNRLSKLNKLHNLDYIKVNHHGSKNGMTENLLKTVNPMYAVISSGFKNRYGHPHAEIVEILKRNSNTKVLRTDEIGDVVIKID